MWFFYALIPCLFTNGVASLPAPQNLSVHSTNMKHLLTWSPVTLPGETVFYSVEYQGEWTVDGLEMDGQIVEDPYLLGVMETSVVLTMVLYLDVKTNLHPKGGWKGLSKKVVPTSELQDRRPIPVNNRDTAFEIVNSHPEFLWEKREYESLYMSHIWIPSSWCSLTERPQCDVTDDITATVPYKLRVRATMGSQTSAWSTLKHPFNRNSTLLTPPRMVVSKDGFHLVIELEDLGPQFEFLVAYWRREPGAKEQTKVVRSRGVPVHLETMHPGATYCVKAQSLVKAIERRSAFSQAECVEVQGEALPLVLALFAFIGFMLILVVVPLSLWKVGQLLRYSCCPAVVLPDTLKITNSPQKLISCRREEVDACATAMLSSEERFRAWV